jgi:hypothetical protein
MSFLRHGQIYHPIGSGPECGAEHCALPRTDHIVLMSLRPAIPRQVALQQSLPPLHRPVSILRRLAFSVNHHLPGAEEFSTGEMGNFQPALTRGALRGLALGVEIGPV